MKLSKKSRNIDRSPFWFAWPLLGGLLRSSAETCFWPYAVLQHSWPKYNTHNCIGIIFKNTLFLKNMQSNMNPNAKWVKLKMISIHFFLFSWRIIISHQNYTFSIGNIIFPHENISKNLMREIRFKCRRFLKFVFFRRIL